MRAYSKLSQHLRQLLHQLAVVFSVLQHAVDARGGGLSAVLLHQQMEGVHGVARVAAQHGGGVAIGGGLVGEIPLIPHVGGFDPGDAGKRFIQRGK